MTIDDPIAGTEISNKLKNLEQYLPDIGGPREALCAFAAFLAEKVDDVLIGYSGFVSEYFLCLVSIEDGRDGHSGQALPAELCPLQRHTQDITDAMPAITRAVCPAEFAEAAIQAYESARRRSENPPGGFPPWVVN